MSIISTSKLMEALNYYCEKGYQPIDVPLVCDYDVIKHTCEDTIPFLHHRGLKFYNGSAEQSFIQLYKEGKLPNGKYMAVTPCYRHERYVSDTHYLMFMKLELIVVGVPREYMDDVIFTTMLDASYFLDSVGISHSLHQCKDSNQRDIINENDVELGSYGYREMLDGTGYVYGTGCAFPRVGL